MFSSALAKARLRFLAALGLLSPITADFGCTENKEVPDEAKADRPLKHRKDDAGGGIDEDDDEPRTVESRRNKAIAARQEAQLRAELEAAMAAEKAKLDALLAAASASALARVPIMRPPHFSPCGSSLDCRVPTAKPTTAARAPYQACESTFDELATASARTRTPGVCCRLISHPCGGGRPLRLAGVATFAPLVVSAAWSTPRDGQEVAIQRQKQSDTAEFLREMLAEHASVGAFARISLELLRFGAPLDLVRRATSAARDEVRHAQIMAGQTQANMAPGAIEAFELPVRSLFAFASETILDGCVGEGAASVIADIAAGRAKSQSNSLDELGNALTLLAEDELRHAELAFAIVAWLDSAGATSRQSLREAVAKTLLELPTQMPTYGILTKDEVAEIVAAVRQEVFRALALLTETATERRHLAP